MSWRELPPVEDDDELQDPLDPPLRALMSGAYTPVAPLPPDPAVSWESFARDRLEFDAQAAVPVDLLFVTYARWCAAHGEPILPETQVLAWCTAHGATVRTGALSQITAVEGVRVVD